MIIPCKNCNKRFELLQTTEYLLKMGLMSPDTNHIIPINFNDFCK